MNKQSGFEKLIYVAVGLFFFVGYYFLSKEVIKFDPFKNYGLIPTIYFAICVFCFLFAGEKLSQKIGNFPIGSKIMMPFSYIFAPIICVFSSKK